MKLFLLAITATLFAVPAFPQENPMFTISGGDIFLDAGQHGGPRAYYNGWYVIPQYHIAKGWSAIGEAVGLYGNPKGTSANIHSYSAGPLYAFSNRTRVTPFVFGELGDVRVSTAGIITNDLDFISGVGANVGLTNRVALQIIPGEYVLTNPAAGPLHNYGAQVGLAFSFGSK